MKKEELRQLQPAVFDQFRKILQNNQLHHAYLFSGNFASKEMVAFLAQSLYCTEKQNEEACGKCRSCRLIEAGEFADVKWITPVNNNISTDRVRELVADFAKSGLESNRQVFVIDQADKMHPNAANSLLKGIEEPQGQVYVFLLTSSVERILPTIRSRTQIVHFPKNREVLVQKLEIDGMMKNQAEFLADFSRSLEEVESLKKNNQFFDLVREAQKWTQSCLENPSKAFLQVSTLSRLVDDKEKQEQLFRILELTFSKEMRRKKGQELLSRLLLAKSMWQSNVTLQNALEYMLISR